MTDISQLAARWARSQRFDALQLDCITAVVLKILDRKCKMDADRQAAVIAVYGVCCQMQGKLFDDSDHALIQAALQKQAVDRDAIHARRLYGEAQIPKPTMKAFKQWLGQSLFGSLSHNQSMFTS
ncbi:MAG: hypothetical protein PVG66_03250 [Chromatiales bacterium]